MNDASDLSEKMDSLIKGVQDGSMFCELELGKMYIRNDLIEAEKHLRKAAECRLVEAMYFLELVYVKIEDKVLEALDWLCKAAIKGDILSFRTLYKLSANYLVKTQIEDRLSVYFRDICDKSSTSGLENRVLGCCYYTGLCCVQNSDMSELMWIKGK